jgi:site-specific DNA-methyltransferase (adenine-specific)
MELREVELGQIRVKDRAREDKGDIDSLADSIKEKGLIQPITLDLGLKLVAGERRYLAHRKLGLTKIWAVIRDIRTKADDLEIELIENTQRKDLLWQERTKLERQIWDLKVQQLGEYDPTVNPKGWSENKQAKLTGDVQPAVHRRLELAATMAEAPDMGLEECKTEDEAWKINSKLKEHGAQMEMLKKLPDSIRHAIDKHAEHYHVGDAFVGMAAEPDNSFTFAEVDPPYGVDLDKRKSRNQDDTAMEGYQEWSTDSYPAFFQTTAEAVYRLLDHNAFAIFWYGMTWHSEVTAIIRKVGFSIPDIPAIWYKGEAGQTASPDTTLGSCYEPFYLARKGQPKMAKPGRGNVFNYPGLQKKIHPTEKPLVLMEELFRVCLFPGSRILVPFLGSGVSLRAAYKLGHTGQGWDLSQEHKDGFLRRVAEDKTNAKASQA